MKVIGAGFGRTGTKSLQEALEILGYGPCYHMIELLSNPHQIHEWEKAYSGQKVEWENIFKGYLAAVDFPTAVFYKELADYYPEAKVVLTVRDPERWYDSVSATIHNFDPGIKTKIKLMSKMPFSKTARNLFKTLMANNKFIWGEYFEGRFADKSYAIDKFHQHVDNVKSAIPQDRLLVYQVKEGWGPLCKFLNEDEPPVSFPTSNKRANFREWAVGGVDAVLA